MRSTKLDLFPCWYCTEEKKVDKRDRRYDWSSLCEHVSADHCDLQRYKCTFCGMKFATEGFAKAHIYGSMGKKCSEQWKSTRMPCITESVSLNDVRYEKIKIRDEILHGSVLQLIFRAFQETESHTNVDVQLCSIVDFVVENESSKSLQLKSSLPPPPPPKYLKGTDILWPIRFKRKLFACVGTQTMTASFQSMPSFNNTHSKCSLTPNYQGPSKDAAHVFPPPFPMTTLRYPPTTVVPPLTVPRSQTTVVLPPTAPRSQTSVVIPPTLLRSRTTVVPSPTTPRSHTTVVPPHTVLRSHTSLSSQELARLIGIGVPPPPPPRFPNVVVPPSGTVCPLSSLKREPESRRVTVSPPSLPSTDTDPTVSSSDTVLSCSTYLEIPLPPSPSLQKKDDLDEQCSPFIYSTPNDCISYPKVNKHNNGISDDNRPPLDHAFMNNNPPRVFYRILSSGQNGVDDAKKWKEFHVKKSDRHRIQNNQPSHGAITAPVSSITAPSRMCTMNNNVENGTKYVGVGGYRQSDISGSRGKPASVEEDVTDIVTPTTTVFDDGKCADTLLSLVREEREEEKKKMITGDNEAAIPSSSLSPLSIPVLHPYSIEKETKAKDKNCNQSPFSRTEQEEKNVEREKVIAIPLPSLSSSLHLNPLSPRLPPTTHSIEKETCAEDSVVNIIEGLEEGEIEEEDEETEETNIPSYSLDNSHHSLSIPSSSISLIPHGSIENKSFKKRGESTSISSIRRPRALSPSLRVKTVSKDRRSGRNLTREQREVKGEKEKENDKEYRAFPLPPLHPSSLNLPSISSLPVKLSHLSSESIEIERKLFARVKRMKVPPRETESSRSTRKRDAKEEVEKWNPRKKSKRN